MYTRKPNLAVVVATVAVVVLAGCVSGFGGAEPTPEPSEPVQYVIVSDTVFGHKNAPEGQTCAPSNQYKHNQMVVFLIKVIDPETGEAVDNETVSRVEVEIEGGPTLPAEYGGHPGDNPVDYFWAVSWVIPPEHPAGTVDVTISVADDRGSTFHTFGTQQLRVLEGTVEDEESQ